MYRKGLRNYLWIFTWLGHAVINQISYLRDAYRQKQLKEFHVNVINEPIVVDRNIITSYCPETSPHVAFKLLEMLTSKEQMEIVKKAMGF